MVIAPEGSPSAAPPLRRRLLVAAAAAVWGVGFLLFYRHVNPKHPSDFAQIWVAARALWTGGDAYALIGPHRAFDWPWRFLYPMTAAAAIGPLALLPLPAARITFAVVSSGALGWAITRDGYARLPLFLSAPYVTAAIWAQWSPLLTAAFCLPALAWVFAAKPNIGVALVAAAARRRTTLVAVIGGALLAVLTIVFDPGWPARWLHILGQSTGGKHAPILSPVGPLVLLALLRWRRPEARLVVALACVPFTIADYDLLPLFLVPATRVESMVLALLSCLATYLNTHIMVTIGVGYDRYSTPMYVLLQFLPAVIFVLRRPNAAPLPITAAPTRSLAA